MKAALKYRKPDPEDGPGDMESMSEDDQPLGNVTAAASGSNSSKPAVVNGRGPISNGTKPNSRVAASKKRKAAFSSESEDDMPLAESSPAKQIASAAVEMPGAVNRRRAAAKPSYNEESSEDDKPLFSQSAHSRSSVTPPSSDEASVAKRPLKRIKKVVEESEESEDDMPLSSTVNTPAKRKRGSAMDSDADISDATPPAKAAKKSRASNGTKAAVKIKDEPPATPKPKKVKTEKNPPASPRKAKKEEPEEDIDRWWERTEGVDGEKVDVHGDGSVKWTTLVHSGVLFPPPYTPLQSSVKMLYDGKPVDLPPESEEVAYFFAKLLQSQHAGDVKFQENFFEDFQKVLKDHPPRDGTKIKEFSKCNFENIYAHISAEKEKKKAWTKDQKKAEKERLQKEEEPFRTCLLDGRKEKVGNFRVEPPGLFLGRGEHPKRGRLKFRLRPEDISINIGTDAPTPKPNIEGSWKAISHDNTVTWLACWKENINGNFKYVFLAASSSLKGQSDMNKFEKARELKKHVGRIRSDYNTDLKAKLMADRQRATTMYFIDKLALRAGNEKGEEEADTVGCCSLRCEHVTMDPPNKLVFDFLGKDSIRYYNTVEVDGQVFKNIRIFKNGKNDEDPLFDRVTTTTLNKHLQSYMKGLTAKVFRTYNASITLQQQLDEYDLSNCSVMEKLAAYNKANRMVAVLCNHQRTVSKGHGDSMAKMADKLKGLKYDRMKLRHAMFQIEPKKKKIKEYAELESDLDDDFIERWEDSLKEKEIEKARKKFAKENEALEADGKKAKPEKELNSIIEEIEGEFERLAGERGTGKAALKRNRPIEKIEEAIATLDTKIKNAKIQMDDKEEGKQIALGTSKINYLDPRITAAWCKKEDVPINKIFSKSLLQKFPWALGVEEDWKF